MTRLQRMHAVRAARRPRVIRSPEWVCSCIVETHTITKEEFLRFAERVKLKPLHPLVFVSNPSPSVITNANVHQFLSDMATVLKEQKT